MNLRRIGNRFAGAGLAVLACASGIPAMATPVPATSRASPPAAEARNGEAIYGRCVACHAPAHDRTGPRHCGLFGRRAGSVEGFAYSPAMRRSNIVWSERTLDRFLANPPAVIPGTAMGYAGIADRGERTDLIAFLKQMNAGPECAKR